MMTSQMRAVAEVHGAITSIRKAVQELDTEPLRGVVEINVRFIEKMRREAAELLQAAESDLYSVLETQAEIEVAFPETDA